MHMVIHRIHERADEVLNNIPDKEDRQAVSDSIEAKVTRAREYGKRSAERLNVVSWSALFLTLLGLFAVVGLYSWSHSGPESWVAQEALDAAEASMFRCEEVIAEASSERAVLEQELGTLRAEAISKPRCLDLIVDAFERAP